MKNTTTKEKKMGAEKVETYFTDLGVVEASVVGSGEKNGEKILFLDVLVNDKIDQRWAYAEDCINTNKLIRR
jgi:hypothetical protein